MKEENLTSVLTNLVHARNDFDDDIVQPALDTLSEIFNSNPEDIECFYTCNILEALKSRFFSRNLRLLSNVV